MWLIDWKNPLANHFGVAEEVTVQGKGAQSFGKRPDVVLYINGIALGVLELERPTVAVSEGIRQNLDNQKPEFIEHFFSTIRLMMAGNDTEGLRYGTIQTPEKYFLKRKEEGEEDGAPGGLNLLDSALSQMCAPERLLELAEGTTYRLMRLDDIRCHLTCGLSLGGRSLPGLLWRLLGAFGAPSRDLLRRSLLERQEGEVEDFVVRLLGAGARARERRRSLRHKCVHRLPL